MGLGSGLTCVVVVVTVVLSAGLSALSAGFAGLATAYHLAAFGSDVTVFDPHDAGTGSSASSVAAGLLHPLTPRGKLIWKGEEGFKAAKHLIEVGTSIVTANPEVAYGTTPHPVDL